MLKTYVLDTNVLIQSPTALESFEENHVVIPIVVIEELDSLKNAEGEKGANARSAIRLLERLRQQGDLLKGIRMDNGGTVRVEMNFRDISLPEDPSLSSC